MKNAIATAAEQIHAAYPRLPELAAIVVQLGAELTADAYEELLTTAGLDPLTAAVEAARRPTVNTCSAVLAARHLLYLDDRDGRRREAIARAGRATGIEFTDEDNPTRRLIVHPSARRPGLWQLTRLDAHGPYGHSDWETRDDAIASAIGAHSGGHFYDDGSASHRITALRP